jgi:hypothetical protein
VDLFADPPGELGAKRTADGITLELRPWLTVRGTGDVARIAAVLAAVVFAWRVLGRIVVFGPVEVLPVGPIAAVVVGIAGAAWIGVPAVRDWRKHGQTLTVTVSQGEVRLRWEPGGAERRWRYGTSVGSTWWGVSYQRTHVVAQVAGAEPLEVPLERLSDSAVAWFADRLGRAARQARA